ncbi:TPA: host cell division inhibitor Icd-like protein [Escherichia coli]|nr:putative prophage protein [Escherichia coli 2-222-05_S4_C2]KEO04831.1 putative prophage protein [Escherichia coli 2-222-05_S4_C3]HCO6135205.1 host cell division inhibitor Icd-like protein [Escherichia coli]HCO6140439.1 host cell division inhibitor Icd-like protein [Escherichia coli]HCO9580487.1 host cell division inhibitor Icd-like protein [Escherichia coli]
MNTGYTPEQGRGFVRPGETKKPCYRVFSGIKKAAPIRNRLSEQLTCCEKNGSVQGNYINRVVKRHYCRITGKTKATAKGSPVGTRENKSITNNATFAAGGQCDQSDLVRSKVCNESFFLRSLRNFSRANEQGANLSDSCSIFLRRLFRVGDNVLVNSLSVIVLPCIAMRRSYSHHGADSDYSDSLAFRRCSYFNLRPQASKTHAEKLALGLVNFSCSTLASIPSISSCGNRIFFFADLLFVLPLDIDAPHLNGLYGRTQYSKKNEMLSIDMCAHMILICAHSLSFVTQIKQRPAVLATHAGRLTTNDSRSIEAAMRNYTRHPQGRDSYNLNKYIWRFIALSTAQPRVITIEATSEQEARQQSPDGCVMVFAARIRQGETYAQ